MTSRKPKEKSGQFEIEEIPTTPQTPISKSGKFKICFICTHLVDGYVVIDEQFICHDCNDSAEKSSTTYSIINK
jgi:hypothetical protein